MRKGYPPSLGEKLEHIFSTLAVRPLIGKTVPEPPVAESGAMCCLNLPRCWIGSIDLEQPERVSESQE
jgi:hypothetical protein